ncbi:MAG TPA: hypothetical protein VII55_00350 [Candidatus Saccharimonadales bacterium]
MSTYPNTTKSPDIRLNSRGRLVAALGVAAVTTIAAFPSVGKGIAHEVAGILSSGPSAGELSQLPTRSVAIPGGSGADYAIAQVDPQAFNNGHVLSELEDIVGRQTPNGVPQPNETVKVPVLPVSGS